MCFASGSCLHSLYAIPLNPSTTPTIEHNRTPLLTHWYTTVPAQVPPLTVHFINDSPRVINNSLEADIVLSRPVQSLVCYLKSTSMSASMDCEYCSESILYAGDSIFKRNVRALYTVTNLQPRTWRELDFLNFSISGQTM